MGQAHPMGLRERREVVRSTMRNVGPSVTQDEVNRELERIGQPGVSKVTFLRQWERVFKPLVAKVEPVAAVPVTLQDRDARLSEFVLTYFAAAPADGEAFVRFAFAVEAAGGVAKAEEFLALVKRVR